MAVRGKIINIYLMDGEASGRIKATISNWSGVAYKIPRDKLSSFDTFAENGVYFLFGPTHQNHRGAVYIGQSGVRKIKGSVLTRLSEHNRDPEKAFWTDAVVFTTSNNSFGPTELSYLENLFCNVAKRVNNYDVKNAAEPTPGNITEEKESELEEFFDYAQLILGVLGYKVFEKPLAPSPTAQTATVSPQKKNTQEIPPLPDSNLKIGEYVRTAMRNLAANGHTFTPQQINQMCTAEWSKRTFHTKHPFFKKYTGGKIDIKGQDGFVRFWSEVFTFGSCQVLVSKEWYSRQFDAFNHWYQSLS